MPACSRRQALATLGRSLGTSVAVSAGLPAGALVGGSLAARPVGALAAPRRATGSDAAGLPGPGRLRQSVARWCFARTPLEELCAWARELGMSAIDLLGEAEWETPKRYGLACSMGNSFGTIPRGFNRPDLHDELVAAGSAMIPRAAAAGVTKVVVFSGNRGGLSDGEGIANCIAGFRRLMPVAERHGVTLCLEMLNSKVDHKDYHADHTAWAVEVAKGVDSPRFRLLYDVYHMQVMEGDVIATIRANLPWIAHVHTAGVPGRHEIDGTQELNYRRIAEELAALGFDGYVAHEFVPTRAPREALAQAVALCTV
jgi:hydroxypyruvate isomerase